MNPICTFLYGLTLLIILFWYFVSESDLRKRVLGTVLTVLTIVFCLIDIIPPFDVKDAVGKVITAGKIHLGLDLQGGTSFLIRLDPPTDDKGVKKTITPDMVDQAVEAIRKRVDRFGTGEPIITPQGTDRILVQIPGITSDKIAGAREQLRKVAKLEFKLVYPGSPGLIRQIEAGQAVIPPGYSIEQYNDTRDGKTIQMKLLVKKKADLPGSHVTQARPFYETEGWGVTLQFDGEGADEFATLTKQVAVDHSAMAIVLDGKVISAPGVDAKYADTGIVGGSAQITGGGMDEKSSRNLASALENPLQTPVIIDEERQASATLGSDSIKSGIYAGIAGLILVAVFMVIYYRMVGFIAIVALVINCVMVLGALAMFNSVLTLPGIAGLILSLGIAIDANVLIYERLREELDHGKSLRPAVDASYGKAFSAIFDAHVTQFLTAAILFWLANGPVKGFALTLTIGIVASMFSSLLITHTCFSWAFAMNALNKIHVGPLVGRELAGRSAVALLLGLAGIFIYVSLRFETSFAIGSVVALAHDLIITLGIFALSGRELSLIMVGAILSIAGYSTNDKIVVFDRIRSGLRENHGNDPVAKVVNTSINETLSRTILTGGTALLTVLALYFFGGPVLNDFAFCTIYQV